MESTDVGYSMFVVPYVRLPAQLVIGCSCISRIKGGIKGAANNPDDNFKKVLLSMKQFFLSYGFLKGVNIFSSGSNLRLAALTMI
jgi:hypothetical protein